MDIHNDAPLQQHGGFDHPVEPHGGLVPPLLPQHGMKAELQHGVPAPVTAPPTTPHPNTLSDAAGTEPSMAPRPDPTTPDPHPKLSLLPKSMTTSRQNPIASGPPSKLNQNPDAATTPRPDPASTTTSDAPRAGVVVERADLLQTIRQQRLEKDFMQTTLNAERIK